MTTINEGNHMTYHPIQLESWQANVLIMLMPTEQLKATYLKGDYVFIQDEWIIDPEIEAPRTKVDITPDDLEDWATDWEPAHTMTAETVGALWRRIKQVTELKAKDIKPEHITRVYRGLLSNCSPIEFWVNRPNYEPEELYTVLELELCLSPQRTKA